MGIEFNDYNLRKDFLVPKYRNHYQAYRLELSYNFAKFKVRYFIATLHRSLWLFPKSSAWEGREKMQPHIE